MPAMRIFTAANALRVYALTTGCLRKQAAQ